VATLVETSKPNQARQVRHTRTDCCCACCFSAPLHFSFWYLKIEEADREQEAVKRDVEYSQQRLRLRLLERQEQIMRLARDVSNKDVDQKEFSRRAEALVLKNPEVKTIAWIDERRKVLASRNCPECPGQSKMARWRGFKVGRI
jgi:hypothetical protein